MVSVPRDDRFGATRTWLATLNNDPAPVTSKVPLPPLPPLGVPPTAALPAMTLAPSRTVSRPVPVPRVVSCEGATSSGVQDRCVGFAVDLHHGAQNRYVTPAPIAFEPILIGGAGQLLCGGGQWRGQRAACQQGCQRPPRRAHAGGRRHEVTASSFIIPWLVLARPAPFVPTGVMQSQARRNAATCRKALQIVASRRIALDSRVRSGFSWA